RTSYPDTSEEGRKRAVKFYDGLIEDLRRIPGVSGVGGAAAAPGRVRSNGGYWVDKLPERLTINSTQAVFSVVAPGTFQAMGIPLKSGHDFSSADVYDAPFVTVINEALAKKSFPGQDPIGHILYCGMDSPNPMKIVGVVGNVRQWGPATPPWPEIFMPYAQ